MERPDTTREEIESREEASLAPYASRSGGAIRARKLDPEGRLFDYRSEYQRDRDRILHARAFRRLRLKCDRGALGRPDIRRDRLTHTLEVSQIARTIARALRLNEDLAEAIALGHALGSPPFGREGARALSAPAGRAGRRSARIFDARLQSLRVVDLLEKRYEHPGLNLTRDVREGIFRQPMACCGIEAAGKTQDSTNRSTGGPLDGLDAADLSAGAGASFESQAVAAADRIAAILGEMDDALRASEIDPAEAERLPLVRELLRKIGGRYPSAAKGRLAMKANVLHRGLTHLLVTATIHHSRRSLRTWSRAAGIETREAFIATRASLPSHAIDMSPRTRRLFEAMTGSLASRLDSSADSALAVSRARRVLHGLREAFLRDPRLADDYLLIRYKEISGGAYLRDIRPASVESEIARRYHGSDVFFRLITDHIAGMTDAFALSEYGRLFGAYPLTGGSAPLP